MNETTRNILGWIIVLALPWALAFNVITGVVGRWVPAFEYNKANFPADQYGFTKDQRLELALVAVDFLEARGSAESTIFMLEEQVKPGTNEPLYNEREIHHMIDVKNLTNAIRTLGSILGVVAVGSLVALLYRPESAETAYRSLRNGGYLTLIILAGIGGFMLLFWDVFFVTFHELLFPEGSWTFYWDDSLIRLFPEKLWIDVGAYIVGGTLVLAILAVILGRSLMQKEQTKQSKRKRRPKPNRKKR